MKLQFVDYAIAPQAEQTFEDAVQLGSFLEKQRQESMMCQLISESGYKLQIGIDGHIGCAQFLSNDDDPPYYMAISPVPVVDKSHEFYMTGSATEVAIQNCLPFDLLKKVVLDFLQTGQRSNLVQWEEV